jgi:glycosyltransferase involved in cell wall biosynthesis
MKVSIVMSTRDKTESLKNALCSIFIQQPPFDYEVIVVDDGTPSDSTRLLCEEFPIRYYRLENPIYRNPSVARNYGYKRAVGNVLILQSDDVIHANSDTIERLAEVVPGTFNIASVYDTIMDGQKVVSIGFCKAGIQNPRPLFFLGSMLREHCYKIGGNSEDFKEAGYEDYWFGECLMHGLDLKPVYHGNIVGYHQEHTRPPVDVPYRKMKMILAKKHRMAVGNKSRWVGEEPWDYEN